MDKKQYKYDKKYMEMAKLWAELSVSTRNKVGALIIKNGTIIADGFNGTPSGFDNNCEDENGDTNWFVIHAEANAILKVAKSTQNIEDSTLYTTLSPCKECCKLILQAGKYEKLIKFDNSTS